MANLASLIEHQARRKPEHPAIIDGSQTINYHDLAKTVRSWAISLSIDFDLRSGDVIGVGMKDTAEHIIMNWAIARLGGIILPVDHRWTETEKTRVLTFFQASAFVSEDDTSRQGAIRLDSSFKKRAALYKEDFPFPEEDDLPLVLSLSSGTTGLPKGPIVTHKQMRARWVTQLISLGFNERDRYLSVTPLYFGGGRSFTMSNTWIGATVILFPPPFDPNKLISLAASSKATTTLLVPTMLRRLLALEETGEKLLPTLRILLSTGSILHDGELRVVRSRLCTNFLNYYGSTEGGGISVSRAGHGDSTPGSVGQVVFNTEVEIVDDTHQPVIQGEVGHIRYRGEGVATNFFNNEGGAANSFHEGWFYPGDLGRFDNEGFLFLEGRSKDIIIRGGINIYPHEIEATLISYQAVFDAAVVGVPSSEFGEEVVAFVVGDPQINALRRFLAEKLAAYKVPKTILILDSLPKNDLGKVDTKTLKLVAQKSS